MATPKSSPSFKLKLQHEGDAAHATLFRKDGSKPWHQVYAVSRGGPGCGLRAAEAALNGYGLTYNADMTQAWYKGRERKLQVELVSHGHSVALAVPGRLDNPMTTGKKVAIGAAAVGGVAGLIGLGVWLWKRRQAAVTPAGPEVSSAPRASGGGNAPPTRSDGGTETMISTAPCPPGTRDDGQQCVPEGGFESNPFPDGFGSTKCSDCGKILMGSPAGFALCMATCDRSESSSAGGGGQA